MEPFLTAMIDYQADRLRLVDKSSRLPYVSGAQPFYMNRDGHSRFLRHVSCYRRKYVDVDSSSLDLYHSLGLLNPDATIQNNGTATGIYIHFLFVLAVD